MEKKELLKSSIEFSNLLGIELFSCSRLQKTINQISENEDNYKEIPLFYIIEDVNTQESMFFRIENVSLEQDGMISLNWNCSERKSDFTLNDLIIFMDSLREHVADDWGNFMVNCENLFVANYVALLDDKLCFSYRTLNMDGGSF